MRQTAANSTSESSSSRREEASSVERILEQSISTLGGLAAHFDARACRYLIVHPSLRPHLGELSAESFLAHLSSEDRTRLFTQAPGAAVPLTLRGPELSVALEGTVSDVETGRILVARRTAGQILAKNQAIGQLDTLARERLLLATAEEVAQCGTWQWDAVSGEVQWSAGIYRIMGLNPEDGPLPFEQQAQVYLEESYRRLTLAVQACVETGLPYALDLEMRLNGQIVWTHARGHRIFESDGGNLVLVGTLQNIDERKRHETQLEQTALELRSARDRAQQADRAKSAFLATMTHELRTPMNGVIGAASLLLDHGLDFEGRELVHTVRSSGTTLLSLIDDILDFSKIEAGEILIENHPFELEPLVEDVVHSLLYRALSKNIRIDIVYDSALPRCIHADSTRIRQILLNLVGNAVKFTSDGVISISMNSVGDQLRFSVEDTGIGISPEVIPSLFRPFMQADASTSRRFGGTGLGLSICHQLVKLMGGHLDVDSQEGIGSRFYFDLPFVPAPDDNTTPQLDDVRLAVIGQQLPEKHRIERLLRAEGARLVPASVALLKIFVGTSTDAAIDADIIVWPSSSLTDRTDSAIHFTQPIRRRTLVDACKGNIGRPPAKPHSNRPPEAHAEHPQVLVVDDNPVNRLVASKILQRLGVDVDVAEDGPTAVKACRSGIYELVFMDLQMPGMDGFEATERLKGEHGQRTPRVVALTASTLPEDHMRAKAAGMVDFLTKPIQLDDVRGLLERQSIMPRSSAVNQRTSE